MKKNLFDNYDLIGFSEITNEKELISTNAGCDTSWLNAQYEHTNGDYVNPQAVEAERLREEASSYYGTNNKYGYSSAGGNYNGGSYGCHYSGK